MIKISRKNVKPVFRSVISALSIVLVYIFLRANGIIVMDCPFSYLNPWQYFFSCSAFNLGIFMIIFISAFTVSFFVLRKMRY